MKNSILLLIIGLALLAGCQKAEPPIICNWTTEVIEYSTQGNVVLSTTNHDCPPDTNAKCTQPFANIPCSVYAYRKGDTIVYYTGNNEDSSYSWPPK
jgi:hypothetical protein